MRLLVLGLLIVGVATAAGATTETVTITAIPGRLAGPGTTSLSGQVSSAKAGELVTVEAKECPARVFRKVDAVRTTAAGAWSTVASVAARTVFRVRWHGVRSRNLTVLLRPQLVLSQLSRQQFRAEFHLGVAADGKRLQLQRFEAGRGWRVARTIVFRNRSSNPGWPVMTFRAAAAKGTPLRLSFPPAEAAPCYLAGYSNILTT